MTEPSSPSSPDAALAPSPEPVAVQVDTTPAAVPVAIVNNVVQARSHSTRRWALACALFLGGGLFAGYQCGHKVGLDAPKPVSSASLPPIHVQAAVAQSKWEDERYRRVVDRLDGLEHASEVQAKMIADLLLAAHNHTHRAGDQAVLIPHPPGSIELVPVPAPSNGNAKKSSVF